MSPSIRGGDRGFDPSRGLLQRRAWLKAGEATVALLLHRSVVLMRHQDHRSPPPASGPPTPPTAWWRISPRLPPRLSRRSPSIFMEAQVQVTQRGSGRAWPCHQHRVRVLVRVSREIVSQCGGQAAQPCPPVRAPRSSCTCRCWSSNLQAGRRLVSCGGADHTKGGGKVAKEGTGSTDLAALEKMRLGLVASPPHRHLYM